MGELERRAEREKIVRQAALIERLHGPTREQGCFDHAGCPKCKATGPGYCAKVYCYGDIHETRNDVSACRREGDHLHCRCNGCGFAWVEHTMDHIGTEGA
jgi:hypothetical protein